VSVCVCGCVCVCVCVCLCGCVYLCVDVCGCVCLGVCVFSRMSEQAAVSNCFVFIVVMLCVYCTVRTRSLST